MKYNKYQLEEHNQERLKEIGSLLREFRRGTLFSREELAKEYGINKNVIEQAERGRPVHFTTYLRLADIYELSVEELFKGIE